MITEDYVSFEVAKLLKEKGFKEITQGYINTDREVYMLPFQQGVYELSDKQYPYPTLQMALKWLREVHKYLIVVGNKNGNYLYLIKDLKANTDLGISNDEYITYEEAVEAVIEYCLINLIK